MNSQRTPADLEELADVVESSARAGAAELMRLFGTAKITEKAPRDLVTEADIASQNAIRKVIKARYPDHFFVGEENLGGQSLTLDDLRRQQTAQPCWIVDPLDGTTNYAHGMHSFAVSVAVLSQGKVLAGAVYDPAAEEFFAATAGKGATLNQNRISTSACHDLEQALIAASFSARVSAESLEVARFVNMLERCQALRRLGSAALNLCYVAAGRLDGYWATSVKTWDIAAGYLIAVEAGAKMTQIDDVKLDIWNPQLIAASNAVLHEKMQRVLGQAKA